jgi:hypothetical protein
MNDCLGALGAIEVVPLRVNSEGHFGPVHVLTSLAGIQLPRSEISQKGPHLSYEESLKQWGILQDRFEAEFQIPLGDPVLTREIVKELLGAPCPAISQEEKAPLTEQETLSSLNLVKLKNGTEHQRVFVAAIMMSLEHLMSPGTKDPIQGMADAIAFYELVMIARDPSHRAFGNTGPRLEELLMLEPRGHMKPEYRDVILSAVTGEGFNLILGNPLA